MKPSKALLPFLTAIAVSSLPLHAATINLDLSSNNAGGFTLDAGSNTFSFTGFEVDYLIVGGGGGGASTRNNTGRAGGGGGAGGLLEGTTNISGVQSIVVGAGGAGGAGGSPNGGGNGQDSVALSLTAIGGGGGGNNVNPAGLAGGSGGGAGSPGTDGGTGTVGQGNDGASSGTSGENRGGGGGGAGGAGVAGNDGGAGGAGLTRSITDASVTYAQGGDGGSTGARVTATPAPAPANTGNGGLGITPETSNAYDGGDGGSGIVVVRYTGSQVLAGGIVSTVGGDTVHQFTDIGSTTMGFSATIAGNIDGAGDLDWDGGGTLTLTGTNFYTGATAVTLGTLLLNGSIESTANLFIDNDGTLFLGVSGVINVLQSNYSIAEANDDIVAGLISGADNLQVSTFNDGSNDYTQISVIPEPTTALLGGLGMLFLLRRRRA